MNPVHPVAVMLLLAACTGDETIARYGGADKVWHLTGLNGAAYSAQATLIFAEPGRIAGDAPCNAYSAAMTAPYPWFETGPIAATRKACPDLANEAAYFGALGMATESEVLGDTLVLRGPDVEMVFKAAD